MKSKLLVALLCSLSWLSMANAADRYISDDVYAYLHAGPSNKFRILGSIKAGETVTELARDAQTKYVHIRDAEGRTGWVEGTFVQSEESFRSKLPKIESELINTKAQLSSVDERHEQDVLDKTNRLQLQDQELTEVQAELSALRQQHDKLNSENQRLTSLMDNEQHQMRLDWLLYGGMVAGIGALFGFLLPLIPRRKSRHQSRWMN
ncbi:TIGR04211 family SH3 domain-containing protein [Oceanisphaera sp. IT1-181]|uniref:TIGR04211 family SH3 domain-containing protein n=1 Tax=Oceanisphaera sp. IT1-181 TaxID=3081199 RepID=UPI0029CA5390|nr:TIGR04211 family SH3 domain-containing protein [Oceanisphaera sp. IT1-181]